MIKFKPQRTTIPDGMVEHIVKRWFDGTELDKVFYRDALEGLVTYLHNGNDPMEGAMLIKKWTEERRRELKEIEDEQNGIVDAEYSEIEE